MSLLSGIYLRKPPANNLSELVGEIDIPMLIHALKEYKGNKLKVEIRSSRFGEKFFVTVKDVK